MKLVTYNINGSEQLAFYHDGKVYDTKSVGQELPGTMKEFLQNWDAFIGKMTFADGHVKSGLLEDGKLYSSVQILAPVTHPTSCRDGYAFRQHVAAARRNRKVEMIAEFDQYPIFYFTNHNAIQGPGPIPVMPDHLKKLDFELEAAIVICKKGRNVRAADADEYIGGYMIMNDMSARTLQMEEMLLNLGPAKGKDFSTVIGPLFVTKDELSDYKVAAKKGHTGDTYSLKMTCSVNGKQVSEGNMGDMDWTFAEIVERCAYGADILPGDVIGSGTVGTGCFLELNGTGKLNDPAYPEQWLQVGDVVEMTIDGLGCLSNTIVLEDPSWSILAQKKMDKVN